MDKEWVLANRLSDEYKIGVESFLQYATLNTPGGNGNIIPCPCVDCGNLKKNQIYIVRLHLLSRGIDKTYHTWIWHGEKCKSEYSMKDDAQVPHHDHDSAAQEPVDMVHAAYGNSENSNEFIKLLEDAEKPLYPECDKYTKLSAVVKLYNLKAKYNWSDNSFNEALGLFGDMLPAMNEMPSSLYDAKKSLVALGMDYEKIHACPNDCILYRKEHKDRTSCPTCGVSRWKVSKNSKIIEGIPAKVLWYFPPIPRFQRMFRNKEVSRELTWHADKRVRDGYLRHPADAPAWKVVDHKWPDFAADPRNLRLALSADGINPHSNMTSNYSCWPVILVTYNLPPWLCMKRKFMMLTMLIAGPKQPGNDIDVYLAPLVEDLKYLFEEGIEAFDAYRDETFLLRAVLLWTINDFPAYGNLSGSIVKGYNACPICGDKTNAKRLKHSRKMSYIRTRRFLTEHHPYRRQKKAFDGKQELDHAPKPLSGREVLKRVDGIKCTWGKLSNNKQPSAEDAKPCWKKKSIFFDLPYWEHLHIRHILDVMHIEKNICESLIGTLLDIPGKTKDSVAARLDLVDMKVRTELAPTKGEKRTFLPPACYTLSKEEKRMVCSSLIGMKVPTGYSSNVKNLVNMKELKLVGLKSHDCHTLMQQLLPVAIRGVLPPNVRHTITRLCFFFNMLCNKVVDVSKLDDMQRDIVTTVCLLEKYFPPSFFDIMVHLTVHLVREVKLCGPVWYRWMYPFERYMRVLKCYVRNRNRPEGCIAECYIAEEALEFCSDYLGSMHTIGIPSRQQKDLTKPLSGAKVHLADHGDWEQAHRYVLENEDAIGVYINEHMACLKAKSGRKTKSQKDLQDEHNKSFITWLRDRVADEIKYSSLEISEKVRCLARGPSDQVLKYSSYLIDGVTYHTRERDNVRAVQNSGVTVVANTMQVSSAKDKNPVVAEMEFYGVIDEIWELDYSKFRIPMFKCSWVETNTGIKRDDLGFTLVNLKKLGFKSEQFILASQAKQVFYIEDPQDPAWSVVLATPSRFEYFDYTDGDFSESDGLYHQCFTKGLPTMDIDGTDENEPPCVRQDCDGTWVEDDDTA